MAETQSRPRLVRFGAFEADVQTAELRKDGVKLKFSGQPFQVLAILLERPGDVVTREELQKRLWPDTFVDVERNLNTAVNKIREVLGDSAESPRFVETLPRRGYRFIGALESPLPAVVPVVPIRGSHFRQTWLKIAAGILAVTVLAFGTVVAYRWPRHQVPQEQAALNAFPFTTFPGVETSPAFSPDGSRIAFAWNGDPALGGKGYDLYVKALGSETLLRLTQHPSELVGPAWSPDGTQIAFHRAAGADTGIYIVPALGGPERKIRSTSLPSLSLVPISWSPDGKWIAFSDFLPGERNGRMSLLSTETWTVKQLPSPPKCLVEGIPVFSHSGDYLAYWCFQTEEEYGIYSIPLKGGTPRMIAVFHPFPTGLTWSSDDGTLIYSLSGELGEVTIANGSVKRLNFAGRAMLPTVSFRGDKLAFSSSSGSTNIWRRDLLHPESRPVELIPSTRDQDQAQYSPDGKRIAFESERSGVLGVWVSDDDGSNLVQISNPQAASGSPQWSPDGKKIAFDSRPSDRWEIYVADLSERIPRKLVTNVSDGTRPTWSRDGKWIYFMSHEAGRTGIFRCPASGGDAIAISDDPRGMVAQESFDGKTAYFANHANTPVLKQVSLLELPGTASEAVGLPRLQNAGGWTVAPGGIYFVPADAPRSLRYFDFATKHVRTLFEVDKDFDSGLSVSPDGRWIIYAQDDDVNGDIMLVDHFH